MDKFREYVFDVTTLWDVSSEQTPQQQPPRLTKQKRPPREPSAEVVQFPRIAIDAHDQRACRRRVRSELRKTAMSLKLRDTMRRNGLADRCAACGRCPDMTD